MKNRQERARLRRTRRIMDEIDRLERIDPEDFKYNQLDEISAYIDEINKVARQIDGYGSLYRWANRLYGQAVRRRRELVDAADFLTWN